MSFLSRTHFRAIMVGWLFLMPMMMFVYFALGFVLVPFFAESRQVAEFADHFRRFVRSLPGRYATTLREIWTGEPAANGSSPNRDAQGSRTNSGGD